MTPRHESGAAIEEVSGMMWMNGSGPKWPDGMYFLSHVPDWNVMMDVALTLSFPTEVGQMYVVDCRVMAYELDSYRDGEVVVRSPRSPDIERRRITEGHLLDAFVATGAMSSFMLAPVLDDGLAFWGCDIGKVAGS